MQHVKASRAIAIFSVILLSFAILSLLWGQYSIDFTTLLEYLEYKLFGSVASDISSFEILDDIFFELRLPRVLLAILIGAALATSGAVFQAMFVNPLVSPGILGVLAGASFGAALGLLLSEHWYVVQILAFAFGFIAVVFALFIANIVKGSRSSIMLVLGGVISGSLFTSLLSVIKYVADPYSTLPAIVHWLMGSLSMAELDSVLLVSVPMLISIFSLIFMSKYFDILSLGDEEASSLGINVKLIKTTAILLATIASSLSVVMAGIIGWIGLIIPHIVRLSFGPSHKVLIPLSAILGAIFLLAADLISRVAFSVEIPIGILTSLIGIAVFIAVLKNARSSWN